MKKMQDIKPVKVNHARVIWEMIKEKGRLEKRKTKPFGGNPTEFFRKIRRETN